MYSKFHCAQLLIRLDRHGCELRVVRRYCEEHGPGTSAGQRGPRGWVAEAWALGAAPGFFWRRCSLLGAALAEPWWALFPTQVRSRCPSLVSLCCVYGPEFVTLDGLDDAFAGAHSTDS